jgi:uncharacterized membrane protein SpoIIM required for sporulation
MISNFWIESRKPQWDRLQLLIGQCGKSGVNNLNRRDLRDFGLLYRQVAADLSILRQDPTGAHYARYVNQLLGRAHSIIYTGKKTSIRSLFEFFSHEWPQLMWRMRGYLATVIAIFLLCGMAGALLTLANGDFALQVLGPKMIDSIERREMWTHSIVAIKPMASSAIMTNNLSVCFTTFAMGATAGIGTLFLIAFNGLLMGVIGAACGTHGMSLSLWSFVAGHGSLELPAIFISGAAGLRIATGMLFPGGLMRRESLRVAGSEAVKLVLGTIPLLVVAGLIEGFFSPLSIPATFKFALGAALFTAFIVWTARGIPSVTASSSASLPDTYSAQRQSAAAR